MKKIKQKTKKAVSKRMIATKSGELKRKHAYRSHLAHNKSTKSKRHSKKDGLISKADKSRYSQLL